MKTCTIFGELTSDSASDNYPTVQICNECVNADGKLQEHAQIVSSSDYGPSFGDTCEFCGKTHEEELQEN